MSLWGIASCIRGGLRCRASLASHHQIRLQVGQGCSRWYSDATVKNEPENEKIGFMDDSDIEELDIDISDFKVDHVEPLTLANIKSNVNAEDPKAISKRPALPRSIKTLNRALGRKQRIEIPEDELIEQFVRGRGPGGQAINKTNSSVSLIHIPTGIRIQSQPTRSREQNRTAARHILSERLDELWTKGLYTPAISKKGSPGGKRAEEKALAESYTKSELRAAKERSRKADRAKKHRRKKRNQAEGEAEDKS